MLPIWMISDPTWPISELEAYKKELETERVKLDKEAESHRNSPIQPTQWERDDFRYRNGENKSRMAAVEAALRERMQ